MQVCYMSLFLICDAILKSLVCRAFFQATINYFSFDHDPILICFRIRFVHNSAFWNNHIQIRLQKCLIQKEKAVTTAVTLAVKDAAVLEAVMKDLTQAENP